VQSHAWLTLHTAVNVLGSLSGTHVIDNSVAYRTHTDVLRTLARAHALCVIHAAAVSGCDRWPARRPDQHLIHSAHVWRSCTRNWWGGDERTRVTHRSHWPLGLNRHSSHAHACAVVARGAAHALHRMNATRLPGVHGRPARIFNHHLADAIAILKSAHNRRHWEVSKVLVDDCFEPI
jgi:hypothetical protein